MQRKNISNNLVITIIALFLRVNQTFTDGVNAHEEGNYYHYYQIVRPAYILCMCDWHSHSFEM